VCNGLAYFDKEVIIVGKKFDNIVPDMLIMNAFLKKQYQFNSVEKGKKASPILNGTINTGSQWLKGTQWAK
jgi:hypothetical protein